MSTGEDSARSALGQSVKENRHQVSMTEESRVLLAAVLRDEMSSAVAKGIQSVMTSEQFWAKVFEVLQKQATERTGRFVLGSLSAMFRKAVWVGVFVLIAYAIGGWALLKAIWPGLTKG